MKLQILQQLLYSLIWIISNSYFSRVSQIIWLHFIKKNKQNMTKAIFDMKNRLLSSWNHQILQWREHCHRTAILHSANRHYRGCQDNQPWFMAQIGLHLGLEALAMRLSRCCACQPITGELAEKDDIIGKLGQMQRVLWLSCPLVYIPRGTIILYHNWQINSIFGKTYGFKF